MDQNFYNNYVTVTDADNGLTFFNLQILLFSEENMEVTQLPPYFHNTEFTKNTTTIPGSLNISRWYRPLHPAFYLHNNSFVRINRGDPILYWRFNTNKKVQFKRFAYTDKIRQIANSCVNIRKIFAHPKLDFIYNLTKQAGWDRRLFREIKSNLIF